MPLKPELGFKLKEPLRYLFESYTERNSEFTPEEKAASQNIRSIHQDRDKYISQLIMQCLNRDMVGQQSKKCFIIKGRSGSGKTILLGKIIGRLIKSIKTTPVLFEFPSLLFSQLRDVHHGENLWDAVRKGISDYNWANQDEDPHNFARRRNINRENRCVIVIDSLDEISRGKDFSSNWMDLTNQLWKEGIITVWSIRNHDYKICNFNEYTIETKKTDNLEIIVEESPLLRVGDDIVFRTEKENPRKYDEWIRYSHSMAPLLFTFDTNPDLEEDVRNEIKIKFQTSMYESISSIENNNPYSDSDGKSVAPTSGFEAFNNLILYDLLGKLMIEFVKEKNAKINIDGFLKLVGSDLYRHNKDSPNELPEVLSDEKYYTDEYGDCIKYLRAVGMFRKCTSRELVETGESIKYRFSHRTFAEYILTRYVECYEQVETGIYDADLFKWRKPYVSNENPDDWEGDLLDEFHSRTGAALRFLPPISNYKHGDTGEFCEPWNSCLSIYPLDVGKVEEKLSDEQKDAVVSSLKKPMMIKGLPGTGKTFTGLHLMLGGLYSNKKARGLIVALNEELSNDIQKELEKVNNLAAIEDDIREEEFPDIIKRIECKSVESLLQDYSTDLFSHQDYPLKIIMMSELQKSYQDLNVKDVENLYVQRYWREAMRDYSERMFNLYSGKLIDIDEYLQQSHLKDISKEELIARRWHDRVSQLIKKNVPLPELIILVRNRFIHRELEAPSEKILEDLMDEFPITRKSGKKLTMEENKEIIEKFETKISEEGYFNIILVDETQDISPQFAILTSFLCPYRYGKGHNLMFMGDEYQSINHQNFTWKTFRNTIDNISKIIIEKSDSFGCTHPDGWNHLKQLKKDNLEVANLLENHRNTPEMVAIMNASNKWLQSQGKEPEEILSRKEDGEPDSVIMIQSETWGDWINLIQTVITVASRNSDISVLAVEESIQSVLDKLMDPSDGSPSKRWAEKTEYFTINGIKGLERNKVIVIGGWMVSRAGVHYDIFAHLKDKTRIQLSSLDEKLNDEQKESIRSRMLVALSRAKEKIIIIQPPVGKSDSSVDLLNKFKSEMLQLPIPHGLERYQKDSYLVKELAYFEHLLGEVKKQSVSIIVLSEGIRLRMRLQSDIALKNQWDNYISRLKNVLKLDYSESDRQDSSLRDFLKNYDDFDCYPMDGVIKDENGEPYPFILHNKLIRQLIFEGEDEPEDWLPSEEEKHQHGLSYELFSNISKLDDNYGPIYNMKKRWKINRQLTDFEVRLDRGKSPPSDIEDNHSSHIKVIESEILQATRKYLSRIEKNELIKKSTTEADFVAKYFDDSEISFSEDQIEKDVLASKIEIDSSLSFCLESLGSHIISGGGLGLGEGKGIHRIKEILKVIIMKRKENIIVDQTILLEFVETSMNYLGEKDIEIDVYSCIVLSLLNKLSGAHAELLIRFLKYYNEKKIDNSSGVIALFDNDEVDIVGDMLKRRGTRKAINCIIIQKKVDLKDLVGNFKIEHNILIIDSISKTSNILKKKNSPLRRTISTLIILVGERLCKNLLRGEMQNGKKIDMESAIDKRFFTSKELEEWLKPIPSGLENGGDIIRFLIHHSSGIQKKPDSLQVHPNISLDPELKKKLENTSDETLIINELIGLLRGVKLLNSNFESPSENTMEIICEETLNHKRIVDYLKRKYVKGKTEAIIEHLSEKIRSKEASIGDRDNITPESVREFLLRYFSLLAFHHHSNSNSTCSEIERISARYPSLPRSIESEKGIFFEESDQVQINQLQKELLLLAKSEHCPTIMKNNDYWESDSPHFKPLKISNRFWYLISRDIDPTSSTGTGEHFACAIITLVDTREGLKTEILSIIKVIIKRFESSTEQSFVYLNTLLGDVLQQFENRIQNEFKTLFKNDYEGQNDYNKVMNSTGPDLINLIKDHKMSFRLIRQKNNESKSALTETTNFNFPGVGFLKGLLLLFNVPVEEDKVVFKPTKPIDEIINELTKLKEDYQYNL